MAFIINNIILLHDDSECHTRSQPYHVALGSKRAKAEPLFRRCKRFYIMLLALFTLTLFIIFLLFDVCWFIIFMLRLSCWFSINVWYVMLEVGALRKQSWLTLWVRGKDFVLSSNPSMSIFLRFKSSLLFDRAYLYFFMLFLKWQ